MQKRTTLAGFLQRRSVAMVLGILTLLALTPTMRAIAVEKLIDDEALEIATEAYFYAFPMVLTDVTLKIGTSCTEPNKVGKMCSPMNQFVHVSAFPDASFTDVVRANADTLYSTIFFDVTKEPLIFHVPDSGGRYYLLPFLDMWSDVFAVPGSRTTGTHEQVFALVGPEWSGTLPKEMDAIRAPTNLGWMIGRTQTNGSADYKNVHKFQAGLKAVPLSAWGKNYTPPKGKVDPNISTQAPV